MSVERRAERSEARCLLRGCAEEDARLMTHHAQVIAAELKLKVDQVERTMALLTEGATLPFVARYRKEVTGNLDEVQIGAVDERMKYLAELDARKQTVLKEI